MSVQKNEPVVPLIEHVVAFNNLAASSFIWIKNQSWGVKIITSFSVMLTVNYQRMYS